MTIYQHPLKNVSCNGIENKALNRDGYSLNNNDTWLCLFAEPLLHTLMLTVGRQEWHPI